MNKRNNATFIKEYLTRKTSQKTPVYGFVYGFL